MDIICHKKLYMITIDKEIRLSNILKHKYTLIHLKSKFHCNESSPNPFNLILCIFLFGLLIIHH